MQKIFQHSGAHLFLLLWKTSHHVMQFDRSSIKRAGLSSLSDFAVLEVLLHQGPQSVNVIGERVLLTSGSITTAIQRLERRGLVFRARGERDARVVVVHLTDSGRELIQRSFAEHAAELDHLFEVFDEAERANFANLIGKLGEYAESLND